MDNNVLRPPRRPSPHRWPGGPQRSKGLAASRRRVPGAFDGTLRGSSVPTVARAAKHGGGRTTGNRGIGHRASCVLLVCARVRERGIPRRPPPAWRPTSGCPRSCCLSIHNPLCLGLSHMVLCVLACARACMRVIVRARVREGDCPQRPPTRRSAMASTPGCPPRPPRRRTALARAMETGRERVRQQGREGEREIRASAPSSVGQSRSRKIDPPLRALPGCLVC